jgi:hypothetical protein
MGFHESKRILPLVDKGIPVIAVGTGKYGKLHRSTFPCYIELNLAPVKLACFSRPVYLTNIGFLPVLTLFSLTNVITYRSVTYFITLTLKCFQDVFLLEQLLAQTLLLLLFVLLK